MTRKLLPLRRVAGAADEMSDEALVAACATGELAALGALFDRYHDAVQRFLARMAGTDDRDLDDLVQITFETVQRTARKYAGRSTVKTWILGIAHNVVRHHVRSEVRRKRLATAYTDNPRNTTVDPVEQATRRERATRLAAAIDDLPPKLREAFLLVYVEGMAGRDVAHVVGAREGTIWKRLHQARARLRSALEGMES